VIKKKRPIIYLLMIGLLSSMCLIPSLALADTTTWKSPTIGVGTDFTDHIEAYSSDDSYASAAPAGSKLSHIYYNYDLGVPDVAIINGIEVRLDYYWQPGEADSKSAEVRLSWDGGTSWTTVKSDSNPPISSEATVIFGGPTDTWGHTWNADQLSNANFRVEVSFDADD
jgi:hypothetical protein